MGEFPIEIWLLASAEPVAEEEARKYWNNKESAAHELRDQAARFWLGETDVELPGNREKRGPVGRVHDLLFLRGTTPKYQFPVLDPTLEAELLREFAPQASDLSFKVADSPSFARFLSKNRGRYLFLADRLLEDRARTSRITGR